MTDEWRKHADVLARQLIDAGKLTDPRWAAAVRSVPRHKLVPRYYRMDTAGRTALAEEPDLAELYANRPFFTALGDGPTGATSSTSQPGLMVRMLELLDIGDEHRVLEIGTGTGYNAALLSHVLGDERVFSVDLDFVDEARTRLAALGYRPTLATGDGAFGLPGNAPYDRIIATCAVPRVPAAWIGQLADGGKILVDLKLGGSAGNLVLLDRNPDSGGATGRFAAGWAGFMSMRHPDRPPPLAPPLAAAAAAVPVSPPRPTTVDPFVWERRLVPWFLAHLGGLPSGIVQGVQFDQASGARTAGTLRAVDGSTTVVEAGDDGTHTVTETGPTPMWWAVEKADQLWTDLGEPGWDRFGVTITAEGQHTIWLDAPDSARTWPLTDQSVPASAG